MLTNSLKTFKKRIFIRQTGNEDEDVIVCLDESMFTHNANEQQWVVGLINVSTNEIRLELVENRNQETLKKIIEKHVGLGNIICTDSWLGIIF